MGVIFFEFYKNLNIRCDNVLANGTVKEQNMSEVREPKKTKRNLVRNYCYLTAVSDIGHTVCIKR